MAPPIRFRVPLSKIVNLWQADFLAESTEIDVERRITITTILRMTLFKISCCYPLEKNASVALQLTRLVLLEPNLNVLKMSRSSSGTRG